MTNANVYTAALMEHNAHPDYKYEMDDPTHVHQGVNPSCGDDITLSLRVEDGIIDEAAFQGSGCAVSQASADIMADIITDKTPEEALELGKLFLAMIRGEVTSEEELAPLGEAAQLQGISRMPARVKCAELGWRTAMTMLADDLSK
ncbi:MAG: SUF system NifU family Fe-S cluster assembly protein [Coriobacteriia bacterium]|nr:SUF system NifU family Fe-S cluster assembly protein [Coriobacteriia bacterium]